MNFSHSLLTRAETEDCDAARHGYCALSVKLALLRWRGPLQGADPRCAALQARQAEFLAWLQTGGFHAETPPV